MTAHTQPDTTHVVTCFLLRQSHNGAEVLLVRRSQQVRTYKGAWAGVSGYLEPGVTPVEQAYTEMNEETRLQRSDVLLVREGEPLTFHDTKLGLTWVIHPFLFRLAENATIRTDWEATEYEWVSPALISQRETVPMLAEALAHVYPQASAE